jgi:hypothetical protein
MEPEHHEILDRQKFNVGAGDESEFGRDEQCQVLIAEFIQMGNDGSTPRARTEAMGMRRVAAPSIEFCGGCYDFASHAVLCPVAACSKSTVCNFGLSFTSANMHS